MFHDEPNRAWRRPRGPQMILLLGQPMEELTPLPHAPNLVVELDEPAHLTATVASSV